MQPGLTTAVSGGFSCWDQLGQRRSCWRRARKAVTREYWRIWLVGTTVAAHLACGPTPLLLGSAWPHGNTMPHPGRRRGDRTPANAPTCIAPASSRAAALLQMQQPTGQAPGSSRVRAHPPTAGESWQPCKQPSHGATSICWAPCGLESVGNLIRLCDTAELFRDRAAKGSVPMGCHGPTGSTACALPEDVACCHCRTPNPPSQCWGDP